MKTLALASFAAALALTSFAGVASAFPLPEAPLAGAPALETVDFVCGPGRHVGYEGKHCWPNHGAAPAPIVHVCPPGTHWGYEGKHCWPNH